MMFSIWDKESSKCVKAPRNPTTSADRTHRAVVVAATIVAAALIGDAGAKYAVGAPERAEMAGRLTEAIDLTSPKAAIQVYYQGVRGQGLNMGDLITYQYDFDQVESLEKRYQGVSRRDFLQGVFARAVKGHESGSDNEKWLAVIDYFAHAMRHPPVEQPMNRDRSMVTDPLILLLLHEGRCGHQARVIVDLALANHYEARLVQLAAHVVAEVKWGNAYHWVDADSGIPIASLRSRFPELPSVEALAQTPYVLDSFAFRDWQWSDSGRRTLDGVLAPRDYYYGGALLPSSVYFGKQIFSGVFGGRNASKAGITYYYKQGTVTQWDSDRSWGWNRVRTEVHPIPTVPVAHAILPLTITGPQAVYAEKGRAVIPIRWSAQGRPVCLPDEVRNCKLIFNKLGYEVRVSSATRGWDYDFRDYQFMPKSGTGDVLVTRDVRKIDDMTFGIDLPAHGVSELFIDVVPVALDKAHSSDFMWPSNELDVNIMRPPVAAAAKSAGSTP